MYTIIFHYFWVVWHRVSCFHKNRIVKYQMTLVENWVKIDFQKYRNLGAAEEQMWYGFYFFVAKRSSTIIFVPMRGSHVELCYIRFPWLEKLVKIDFQNTQTSEQRKNKCWMVSNSLLQKKKSTIIFSPMWARHVNNKNRIISWEKISWSRLFLYSE